MKRHRSITLATLALSVLWATASFAITIDENAGTRAFPSLKIGVGAATVATGEAGIADSADAYSTYWNVAGLARVRETHVALMNNEWVLDIRQNYLAVAHPLSDDVGLGVFLNYLDYGELVGRDENGNITGDFNPFDLAAGVGAGFAVSDDVSVGAQAKFLRQEIDDASANSVAFDAGVRYDVADGRGSLAAVLQHLGGSMTFDTESFSLPTTVRLGGAYRVLDDTATFLLDATDPGDADPHFGAGVSYKPLDTLVVRTGYRYKVGGNDLGAISGLTAGFGLQLDNVQIDYAFVSFGDLGPTNRISLAAAF